MLKRAAGVPGGSDRATPLPSLAPIEDEATLRRKVWWTLALPCRRWQLPRCEVTANVEMAHVRTLLIFHPIRGVPMMAFQIPDLSLRGQSKTIFGRRPLPPADELKTDTQCKI